MVIALFIGRFQPFHKAHLRDIKDIMSECSQIIIAIGSSEKNDLPENPFSYDERVDMIKKVLINNKISNFSLYPIPDVGDDKKWVESLISSLPKFDVVYTGNDWTEKCFKEYSSIKVNKIKLIPEISSTIVREKILKGNDWKKIVPEEIVEYLQKIKGVERIKKLNRKL